jgi:hypothetical protein
MYVTKRKHATEFCTHKISTEMQLRRQKQAKMALSARTESRHNINKNHTIKVRQKNL